MSQRDPKYLAWVRSLPCDVERHGGCLGAPHAHHIRGKKGIGTKRSDWETIPLCTGHHDAIHRLSGPFKGFDKRALRSYEAEASERYRKQYLGLGSADSF